jgi:hypothetical protein
MVREPRAAKVLFRQPMPLDHRAHGAVENENPPCK